MELAIRQLADHPPVCVTIAHGSFHRFIISSGKNKKIPMITCLL